MGYIENYLKFMDYAYSKSKEDDEIIKTFVFFEKNIEALYEAFVIDLDECDYLNKENCVNMRESFEPGLVGSVKAFMVANSETIFGNKSEE